MGTKNFFKNYITILLFFIILLPGLSDSYDFVRKVYSIGIINIFIGLFIFGAITDILLNKKESDFLAKMSTFNVIAITLFVLVLILNFNHII